MTLRRRWLGSTAYLLALAIDGTEIAYSRAVTSDYAYDATLPVLAWLSFALGGGLALRGSWVGWLVGAAFTVGDVVTDLPYSPVTEPFLFLDRLAKLVFLALAFRRAFRALPG